ncbi:Transporter, partial [Caligus rogercresseyi]
MDPQFPNVTLRECEISSETQFFWYRTTLDITPSIDVNGGIRWWMLICLVLSWLLIYAIISKGIQSSGKVVYFTALFPYLVLTIFFIRGITLDGAIAGLAHMFYPKLEKLTEPRVWLDAANQVFYSFGLAFGSFISFGSYNAPEKNIVKDVYQITVCNAVTAVYGCAVVFSILGFKAKQLFDKCMEHDVTQLIEIIDAWKGRNVSSITENEYVGIMMSHGFNDSSLNLHNCTMEKELNQAAEGTGLAFIVMADVFTKLPGAPFWSILFFSMLLSLGLGSQIGILEGLIGIIFDVPRFKNVRKPVLT